MDVWLKWLILRPKSNTIYYMGTYFLKSKYFPNFIFELIFKNWIDNKRKRQSAYKSLKSILENSVFLILDLEENIDFSFNDIDEVKNQNFPKEQLKYVYSDKELQKNKMDYWNMHTYSNKRIESSKISLLKDQNEVSADKILINIAKNNQKFIKENCQFLKEYLNLYQ